MSFKESMWLQYQIDSNWTTPFIFIVYNIIRPIGAALLLVAMFYVVTGGYMGGGDLAFLFVGNAFFMLISQTLFFVGWIVHDDREHYQTLKYIYISPMSYFKYLIARSAMRFLLSVFALIVLLLMGIFFKIPYDLNYLLIFAVFLVGWIFIIGAGLFLSGINMLTARHGGSVGEAAAGIFYLLSGAIFPLTVLPQWVRGVSLSLPSTYWFSLVRRAILGVESDELMHQYSTLQVIVYPLVISLVLLTISYLMFIAVDHLARKKGILDMTTTY